jgi:hypothetical protein
VGELAEDARLQARFRALVLHHPLSPGGEVRGERRRRPRGATSPSPRPSRLAGGGGRNS